MKSEDAMIVWTPNRGVTQNSPLAGTMAVTTIPEPAHLREHPASYGASNLDWKEMTLPERQKRLQELFVELVVEDRIPEQVAREALKVIEDLDIDALTLP